MDTQIVAIDCICDDILKGLKRSEDKQCNLAGQARVLSRIRATFEQKEKYIFYIIVQSKFCVGGKFLKLAPAYL